MVAGRSDRSRPVFRCALAGIVASVRRELFAGEEVLGGRGLLQFGEGPVVNP